MVHLPKKQDGTWEAMRSNLGPAVLRYLRSLPCGNTSDDEGDSGNGSRDGTATAGGTRSGYDSSCGAGDNR